MSTSEDTRDQMDDLYQVPAAMAEEWKPVYTSLVARMRREASGISMSTIQYLLIDRIAMAYIDMKVAESNGISTPREKKELNAAWLSMTDAFNRVLKDSADARRDQYNLDVYKMITEVLQDEVTDKETLKKLRARFSSEFSALNM